jgi:putative ABC transport system substrate-binding protein
MMRCAILIIAALLFISFHPAEAMAQEIVVIKSSNIKPYEESLEGFKNVCNANFVELDVNELSKSELLSSVYRINPDLVLAIGKTALYKIKGIKGIPVVYAMVSNPRSIISDKEHITGVSMNIPIRRQMEEFLRLSPYAKNIGIIYDPGKTALLFDEAMSAAKSLGITVVSREIYNSKDAMPAINDIRDRIDAFLMLPDTTAIKKESVEYLFLTSHENYIPVITFSEKYLKAGAFVALNIDAKDIGRQAGEMARKVLKGVSVMDIPASQPRNASIKINIKTARRFGYNEIL